MLPSILRFRSYRTPNQLWINMGLKKFIRIIGLMVFGIMAGSESNSANSIYTVKMSGNISKKTWFNPSTGCPKIDTTKSLLSVLRKEAPELGYSHCTISEERSSEGYILRRECDQVEGFALFASPQSFCQKIMTQSKKILKK